MNLPDVGKVREVNGSFSLTIAIPTYNRNSSLNEVLKIILPQIKDHSISVLVLDNASDIPVDSTVMDIIDQHACTKVKIVRNTVNIGICANIIKCFELPNTDWVWLLGDDDMPTEDAVDTILWYINKFPNSTYINFASELVELISGKKRKADSVSCGIDEFIEDIDCYSNILFISSGVYKRKRLFNQSSYGYNFAYSMQPHVAMLLMSLKSGSEQVVLSSSAIVRWGKPNVDQSWSNARMSVVRSTLLELPLDLDDSLLRILQKKIKLGSSRKKLLVKVFLELFSNAEVGNRFYYLHMLRNTVLREEAGPLLYLLFSFLTLFFRNELLFSMGKKFLNTSWVNKNISSAKGLFRRL